MTIALCKAAMKADRDEFAADPPKAPKSIAMLMYMRAAESIAEVHVRLDPGAPSQVKTELENKLPKIDRRIAMGLKSSTVAPQLHMAWCALSGKTQEYGYGRPLLNELQQLGLAEAYTKATAQRVAAGASPAPPPQPQPQLGSDSEEEDEEEWSDGDEEADMAAAAMAAAAMPWRPVPTLL